MIIGFTGTRKGMTAFQKEEFKKFLDANYSQITEFHHGDAVGSDFQACSIVSNYENIKIISHPPKNNKDRAFYKSDKTHIKKKYLARNKDIVNSCDILISTPRGKEILRSGTWSTIRYAKKINKKILILNPEENEKI